MELLWEFFLCFTENFMLCIMLENGLNITADQLKTDMVSVSEQGLWLIHFIK